MKNWWHLTAAEIAGALGTDLKTGLARGEAGARFEKSGPNELREKAHRPLWAMFLAQFEGLIIWVLIVAALVSGFLGEWLDALAILAIIVLNAVLGLIQEFRSEKSLAALKKLSAPASKVIRDGVASIVPARELVTGDLIELEAGDHVPADGRVVWHTANFTVQESSLTGESSPVNKTDLVLEEKDIPLADRANIVYMGTTAVSGKARAVIVETGMRTELGRIAGLIQEIKKETTPLQKRLEEFGKWIIYVLLYPGGRRLRARAPAGGAGHGDVPDLGQPGRGRHSRRPAGRRHHRPGPGRPEHGQAPCPHPQAPVRRDARLRHGHLLGQDRHPDQERDDRPDGL